MKRKPTISGLTADLRAANQEAKSYLDAKLFVQKQNDELRKELESLQQCRTTNEILWQIIQRLLQQLEAKGTDQ